MKKIKLRTIQLFRKQGVNSHNIKVIGLIKPEDADDALINDGDGDLDSDLYWDEDNS